MFDKLDDLLRRYEEMMNELHEPDVVNNQERFRKLMKEQSDLAPLVEAYTEYKKCKQDIEDSLAMLESESDEEMREMLKEELSEAKKRVEELEQELKILLLPKDPNDDKNVIVEIRAGAGGDEAALFAAEIYRMYVHYAESQRWRVELINVDEIGIGGMKEVQFTISGQGAYSKMKYESGVHRVQRVPETESGGRIHTSTISVAVMPEVDEDIDIVIDEKDIRIDVMRASGNGGISPASAGADGAADTNDENAAGNEQSSGCGANRSYPARADDRGDIHRSCAAGGEKRRHAGSGGRRRHDRQRHAYLPAYFQSDRECRQV